MLRGGQLPSTAFTPPAPAVAPVVAAPAPQGWDALELDDVIALAAKHNVTLPRVRTHGKVVSLLVAAGVTP